MTDRTGGPQMEELQSAASRLINAQTPDQVSAFENFARIILDYADQGIDDSRATPQLFAKESPQDIQRLTAAWLLWILSKSPTALDFDNIEAMTGSLFDQTLEKQVYRVANIESGSQNFEKLKSLTDYIKRTLNELEDLVRVRPELERLNAFRQKLMPLLNRESTRYVLSPLLPRSLGMSRLDSLFHAVDSYVKSTDTDPIHAHEDACEACDEFIAEAESFGTDVADCILGGLGRQLRSAVDEHFNALEAKTAPELLISAVARKYPLQRPDEKINLKVRVTNRGNGPARELKLDEVMADDCLILETSKIELGTIQPGSSFVIDVQVKVRAPSSKATLLLQLSWLRPHGRSESVYDFTFAAQREDIRWDEVEQAEPYSLEAVTTRDELIGREEELKRLLRLTDLKAVGSGFIYGHKRVGKTSLANAVAERLKSDPSSKWTVISKGSGDYVGDDAVSTLRSLGDVLAQAMTETIPMLRNVPHPDFTNGLAPLSGFVDKALSIEGLRLLFILDEFDDLPPDLLKRTDLSASLFLPLRQISNKPGCGFLLVGGENMQRIVDVQGDRLNKFRPVEVDSFDRSDAFVHLVRRPVKEWLTISDAALNQLFEYSAGNPYFAKLLATELFSFMVEHRYSDASEIEVGTAIDNTLRNIRANSFAHFWTDGLVEASDDIEQQRTIRRSVLIIAGRAFRKCNSVGPETMWAESGRSVGFPVGEQRFHNALRDLVRRKVMVEDGEGNVTPKIPLFRDWLKDNGVRELLEDSRALDDLRAKLEDEERSRVKEEEIAKLVETWQQFRYKGKSVTGSSIRIWLEQFNGVDEQRLMFRLLEGLKMYDEHLVRIKMNEAFGIVTRNMRTVIERGSRVRRDILVSTLDESAAKSGMTYCRLFASENQIWSEAVMPLRAIQRRLNGKEKFQRLVLIDDFAGTGRTLVDGLRLHLDALKRANSSGIRIIVVVVVGFDEARGRIERFVRENGLEADVYLCDELGIEDRAFSESSKVFPTPEEREHAKQIAESSGIRLDKKYPLGYGNTQSAIVFYQSCPNNTLPILWSAKGGWSPLFPRV